MSFTPPLSCSELATHWSALIGASHSANYVPWKYGGLASDGVRRVAEWGSPIAMEEEIRRQVSSLSHVWATTRVYAIDDGYPKLSTGCAGTWCPHCEQKSNLLTLVHPHKQVMRMLNTRQWRC